MNHSSILLLDTLDDRREIWHLLHRLHPGRRVRFLKRCCERVADAAGNGPKSTIRRDQVEQAGRSDPADLRLTNEIYTDLLSLSTQYGLDLVAVARDLEGTVRRPGEQPPVRPAAAS